MIRIPLILSALLGAIIPFSIAVPFQLEERTSSPSPKDAAISNIAYGGTGCPQGSAVVELSSDSSSFSIGFNDFTATLSSILDSRKFCQVNLALSAPSGWQYTVIAANFTGFALLGSNAQACHTSSVYFSGSTDESSFTATLNGPAAYIYNIAAANIVDNNVWSACGSNAGLNIKSVVTLSGSGTGEIIEIGESVKVAGIYALGWRKC
ncbi:hypothetical protein TWF694_001648 [Orbilia ellipsospora]|uniref:Secreted protein n=1 Tax=Orbilia ellipsospora TaxID=2528407 RepID=A0AAV9X3H1_9PEZI